MSVVPVAAERPGGTIGPDVVVPGSQQVLPVLFLLLFIVLALVAGAIALRRWIRRRRDLPRRRPIALGIVAVVALVAAGCAWATRPPPFFVPQFGALPTLVPSNSVFRRTSTDLPVAVDSRRWIAAIGDDELSAGFGGRVVDGVVFGIPYNFVDDSTPRVDVDVVRAPTSARGPFPISDPAYIESMPTYGFDMHYMGVDRGASQVWELISTRAWFGRWEADAAAHYRTDSNDYPTGSTIAAGLPLLPGVITYDEVEAGAVDHVVLGWIDDTATGRWVWPARSTDGPSTAPDAPPQGAWLRLRPDADLSALSPQARVIAVGLQRYGMVLSDTGPGFRLRGTPDARWDDDDLATLRHLTASQFEVVDPSGIAVSTSSLAVRPPG